MFISKLSRITVSFYTIIYENKKLAIINSNLKEPAYYYFRLKISNTLALGVAAIQRADQKCQYFNDTSRRSGCDGLKGFDNFTENYNQPRLFCFFFGRCKKEKDTLFFRSRSITPRNDGVFKIFISLQQRSKRSI